MKKDRTFDLWESLVASLGVGIAACVLSLVTMWSMHLLQIRSMTPYLILLGLALTAFGRMAHGFRRPIWVVWGSLFIGASFTMAYVAYEAALEPNSDSNLGPGIHVLILVVVIGTPTFVLSIITGLITVGFRIVGDRRITRAKTGCLNCGYLRAGLSGPVCPECGNAW